MESADTRLIRRDLALNLGVRQLHAFMAAATIKSFPQAAHMLGQTPSAFSRCIQDLETELGEQLFLHGWQGVTLSPAGRAFLPHARRLLTCHADTAAFMSRHHAQTRCELRLAAAPEIAPTLLPVLLLKLRARFDEVALHCQDHTSQQVAAALADGEADFGLTMCADVGRELDLQPLLQAPIGLLTHPELPLAATVASLKDLPRAPMVRVSTHSMVARALQSRPEALDRYLGADVSCTTLSAALALVRHEGYASIVSAISASQEAARGLRFTPLSALLPSLPVCLAARRTPSSEPGHAQLARLITAAVASAPWHAEIELLPG